VWTKASYFLHFEGLLIDNFFFFYNFLNGGSARRKNFAYDRQNEYRKGRHTFMSLVELKSTIPVFERQKTANELDRAALWCADLHFMEDKSAYFIIAAVYRHSPT
jgi:hypothetical protein